MGLRDVKHTVSDGLLNFRTDQGDGIHIKIGVAPVTSGSPIVITGDMDADKIKARLGLSPLADSVMDAVQFGAGRIYCIPVAATNKGSIGEIVHAGEGTGTVTATGTPTNSFGVIVRISGRGGLNTAAFAVSIDNGYSFGDEITVPLTGSYEIEGTGITLGFAVPEGGSFEVDDTYSFLTGAPVATNGDILAALEKVKGYHESFEFIHIVGESTQPLWEAASAFQQELMNDFKKPAFILLEAAKPTEEDESDLDAWADRMEADARTIRNHNIQVCAAWGLLVKLDGTTKAANLAGLASGRYAKAAVQKSIAQTSPDAGMGFGKGELLELLPDGYDSGVIARLDEAGYLTFREYDGLEDFYVYHTRMLCGSGSDYRYAEDVRVKNKIIRLTRREALKLLNDDVDLEDLQNELETRARFVGAGALDQMVSSREISAYEIIVLEGHELTFPEDETLRLKIRYKSRGYIREIQIDLGRAA